MLPELLPEVWLAAAAAVLYAFAFAADLHALYRSHRLAAVTALVATIAGLGVQSAGIAVRWIGIGHPPVFGTFEAALASTWVLVVGTLLVRRAGEWRKLAVWNLLASVALIAWGLAFNLNRIDLTISERSLWIDLHASVAWIGFFAMTMALWAAVLAVLRAIEHRRGRPMRLLAPMPDRAWADELMMQAISYSFIGISAVIVTGAWYSSRLFGEAWRWDAVEVLALSVWLVLGLGLHARLFYGWRGAKLAAIYLFAYVGVVTLYWVLALLPWATYHYFELPF